jgi:hypothetical protein
MPNYIVRFNGRLEVDAETEQEALESFWASIRDTFGDDAISNVTVQSEESAK